MKNITTLLAALILIPIFIGTTILNCSATSYTWNGGTSTAWGTNTNWTPNGVPGSGDNVTIVTTSNQPVYDGVAGVTNFTMTSGTLNLGGYQLNITGTGTFNGGTINNGRVNATGGTSTFNGTAFGAVVWVNSGVLTVAGSTFNDTLLATKTGSGNSNSGGNAVFNGYARFENSGSGTFGIAGFGNTYNSKVVFNNTSTGSLQVGLYGSGNSTYNGEVEFNNTGSSGNISIQYNSTGYFNNNVTLNCTSTGGITFNGWGYSYIAAGKKINFGSTGWTAGTLTLGGLRPQDTQKYVFNAPSNGSLYIPASIFPGPVEINTPLIQISNSTFQDSLTVIKTGSGTSASTGSNTFNGYTKFENSGAGTLGVGQSASTYNGKTIFNNTSTGSLGVGLYGSGNSTYNGEVEFNNTGSSGNISIQYNSTGYFNNNVTINCTSTGGITFNGWGYSYIAAGKKINFGSTGWTAGTLTMGGLRPQDNQKYVFNAPTNGSLYIAGSIFLGPVEINTPLIQISNSTFQDSLTVIKTGSGTSASTGSNTFNGYTKFENSGAGTLGVGQSASTYNGKTIFNNTSTGSLGVGLYGSGNSTYNGEVEFNNTGSSGNISIQYNSTGYFNNNVTINCTSTGGITFNGWGYSYIAAGKKINFGSTGWTAGTLTLGGLRPQDNQKYIFNAPTNGSLYIAGSIFLGPVEINTPLIQMSNSTFQDSLTVIKTGSGTSASTGSNTFNGYAKFENSGAGALGVGQSASTYNGKTIFNNTSTGSLGVGLYGSGNSTYNGEVEFNNTGSSGNISIQLNSTGYFNNNVTVNCTSTGGITFNGWGANYLASGKTIINGGTGITAGTITLASITQSGNATVNLTGTGSSAISTGNCKWGGNFIASAANIYNTGNNKFSGKACFTKTSNTANTWSGGNKFSDSLVITNTGTSYVLMANGVGADTLLGHVKLNNTSSGTIYAGYNYNNLYYGNLTVSQNVNFANSTGTAILKGDADQTFSRLDAGSTPTDFKKLTVDKTAATNLFTLNKPINVSSVLTLTKGRIATNSTNLLNLGDNVTVSGASNDSYVEGPMKKVGNDVFTYPVGKNGHYRKIGIGAPAVTTDAYTAEYFEVNSNDTYSHSSKDGSLAELSRNEYWNLARTTGTSNVSVTLSIDSATSCAVDNLSNLKVAAWDGTTWKDKGNGGTTGNVYVGTVVSSGASSVYGAYSVGTSTSLGCEPGDVCSLAIDLNTSDTCVAEQSLGTRERWYKFIAGDNMIELAVINYGAGSSADIDSIILYSACNSSLINGTTVYDDGLLVNIYASLTQNNEYYAKLVKSTTGNGNADYKFCVQTSTPVSYENDVEEGEEITSTANCPMPPQSQDYDDVYGRLVTYVPTETTPVKTIKVNIAVFQKSDGSNQFQEEDEYQMDYLRDFIPDLNDRYGSITGPSDPILDPEDELLSTNIQFDIGPPGEERIHFYQDDYLNLSNERSLLIQKIKNTDPNRLDNLNIIFNQSSFYGTIGNVIINDGGSGYNASPIITFINTGGGSDAEVFASVNSSGEIDAIGFKTQGSGYANTTQIIVSDPNGVGSGALLEPIISTEDGSIQGININDGGHDYLPTPIITIYNGTGASAIGHVVDNKIDNVEIVDVGSGYLCPPKVYHNGIIGVSQAEEAKLITVINEDGEVESVTILEGGTDYPNSTVNLFFDPGSYSSAFFQIVPFVDYSSHKITDVGTLGGHNFMCPPELVVTGGGGSGADLQAEVGDNISGNATNGSGDNQSIIMHRSYNLDWVNNFWIRANTLGHEVAHCLSLGHLYGTETCDDSNPDYLDDCFYNGLCPHIEVPWGENPSINTSDDKTNNIMGGSQTQVYFSPKQIGKMHRALSLSGVRNHVKDSPYDITPLHITSDELWDFDIRWYSDIIVDPGASLTITCKVLMADQAKIIVEPGGKLIIDDGIVTAANEVWQGVEVWGNPDLSQTEANQGVIELKNGAIIENAKNGVNLSKAGDCCWNNGGIIQAENSTFRNNRRDVQFMVYPFPPPADPTANPPFKSVSYFNNCTFLTDQPMQGDDYNGLGSNGHVSLWGIRGVEFRTCDFVCDLDDSWSSDNTYHNWDEDGVFYDFGENIRGQGIACFDAMPIVKSNSLAYPIPALSGCNFIGLNNGIRAGRTFEYNPYTRLKVGYSDFQNNQHGILSETSFDDLIYDNNFDVPVNPLAETYGIYTYEGVYFNIYNNTLTGAGEGIVKGIINGGSSPLILNYNGLWQQVGGGSVHDNTLNDLYVGSQPEKNNQGLWLRCNDYGTSSNFNFVDWAVNPESPNHYFAPQGQGCDPTQIRADNEFFNDISGVKHIYSFAQYWKYWALDLDVDFATPLFGTPVVNGDATSCLQIFNLNCEVEGGGIDEKMLAWGSLRDEFETLKDEYENVKSNLDNGDTDTLLARIGRSSYSNATLTTDLITNSLLSDEVLVAACNRTPFFSFNQFVSIINNNSPVSREVWEEVKAVYYESSNPPDTIMDAQVTDTLITLTTIEREMALVYRPMDNLINEIVYLYADSNEIEKMVTFLNDSVADKRHKKQAVSVALAADTVTWSRDLLDNLTLENDNDTAFYEFYDVAVTLAEDTLTWFGMNGTQLSKIHELSETDYEVRVTSQAVLALVEDSVYERVSEVLPEISGKWEGENPNPEQQQTPEETSGLKSINIYPNPFNNSFNINYTLEEEAKEIRIEVYDLVGRIINTRKIGKTTTGNITIDLGECLGIYVLRVFADERQVHKEKLVCLER